MKKARGFVCEKYCWICTYNYAQHSILSWKTYKTKNSLVEKNNYKMYYLKIKYKIILILEQVY